MPGGRRGIAAAGNWIVDRLKTVDAWPAEEALANVLAEGRGTGGSPFNLLVDLARLGAPFPLEAVGLVGEDPDGRWVRAVCRRHGIAARHLARTLLAPTSTTDVMTVASTGRRTFFHARGANALLGPGRIPLGRLRARILHLGYLLLLDGLDRPDRRHGTVAAGVLARARALGIRTSVDLVSEDSDRFRRLVPPALAQADYAFMNEFEAGRTLGVQLRARGRIRLERVARAGKALLGLGVKRLAVIHFPEGAFAAGTLGESRFQPALSLPRRLVAGAVGAGDALAAGALLGLHEGWPLPRCLALAVSAAGACLGHPSATEGVPPWRRALAFGRRYGLRP